MGCPFRAHRDKADLIVLEKLKKLKEIKRTKGEEAYIKALSHVLKTDIWFLIREALGADFLDENVVCRDVLGTIEDNWGKDTGIIIPRGYGKTWPISSVITTDVINNPDVAILQFSRTQDNAKKFGAFIGDILMHNEHLQKCFGIAHREDGFLPSSKADTKRWGDDGLILPRRRPRLDPTLLCISLESGKAGKHPDWIFVDDPTEEENNNPKGYQDVIQAILGMQMLLPSSGFFIWAGTRWGDGDPLGMAIKGHLEGKQGKFKTIVKSCFIDDMPEKGSYFPEAYRWGSKKKTGYSVERLKEMASNEIGGKFFGAQMRNDPKPLDQRDIRVEEIHIVDKTDIPNYKPPVFMGIEVTGGGQPIYSGFEEYIRNQHVSIPIYPIESPRKEKEERILATLQPPIDKGIVHALEWMIGDESATDNLGYELRRLGVATHDDIVDALHNIFNLQKGVIPPKGAVADCYIAVDLAWTEKKRSDYTVALAACFDAEGNCWIIDYDRFRSNQPTVIYQNLIAFYNKIVQGSSRPMVYQSHSGGQRKKHVGAWR